MNANLIQQNISAHHDLWKHILITLMLNLLGVISKSTRGVTLNFDGETIEIRVIFDKQQSETEIDDLQNVEAELVSSHDYMSNLDVVVAPPDQDISTLVKNWGWVYLRKES